MAWFIPVQVKVVHQTILAAVFLFYRLLITQKHVSIPYREFATPFVTANLADDLLHVFSMT